MRTGKPENTGGSLVMHLVARRGILSPGWIITHTISSRYRRIQRLHRAAPTS